MSKKDQHEGVLTAQSKRLIAGGYEFIEEDRFQCTCGAVVNVRWDPFRNEHVPRPHTPKPRPKPYNSGNGGGKR